MPKTKIAVIIVTHGDRWKFLSQVLEVVIDEINVCKVILVDNASVNNLEIDYFVNRHFFKTELVRNESNLGSASGFAQGVKYAKILDCEYVLFLDDDNVPEKDFVDKYLNFFKSFNEEKVAILGNKKLSNLNENYFFSKQDEESLKAVSGFSYGGLFLPKTAVKDIPLPDEKLFSHGDDIEYGLNIIKSGYKIYEPEEAIIKDLNVENEKEYKEEIFSKEVSDFKVFLKTRNMIVIYLRNTKQSKLVGKINMVSKFFSLCFYGFSKSGINGFTLKRLSLIHSAIHHGVLSNFEIPKGLNN